jgi:hypothetical protein
MDTRDYDIERARRMECYHVRPSDPSENPQGDLGAEIMRDLLALPPAVLDRPVFRKLQANLKTYRKLYVTR